MAIKSKAATVINSAPPAANTCQVQIANIIGRSIIEYRNSVGIIEDGNMKLYGIVKAIIAQRMP